jgi:hypothetical protein
MRKDVLPPVIEGEFRVKGQRRPVRKDDDRTLRWLLLAGAMAASIQAYQPVDQQAQTKAKAWQFVCEHFPWAAPLLTPPPR